MIDILKPDVIKKSKNNIYVSPDFMLRKYIAHYTVSFQSDNKGPSELKLIPDASGCMIFTYKESRLECHLWGPTTKTVIVKNDVDEILLRIFVEFLPCGLYHLTGINIGELTDLKLDLKYIDNILENEVQILFHKARCLEHLIASLDKMFVSRLYNIKTSNTAINIIRHLKRENKIITVKGLSEETFYSGRNLNRIFTPTLGINIKKYLRILRINKAIQFMKTGSPSLTDLGQSLGYYDQAHFIHDFKLVCGISPSAYIKNMSDFYNENYKF